MCLSSPIIPEVIVVWQLSKAAHLRADTEQLYLLYCILQEELHKAILTVWYTETTTHVHVNAICTREHRCDSTEAMRHSALCHMVNKHSLTTTPPSAAKEEATGIITFRPNTRRTLAHQAVSTHAHTQTYTWPQTAHSQTTAVMDTSLHSIVKSHLPRTSPRCHRNKEVACVEVWPLRDVSERAKTVLCF